LDVALLMSLYLDTVQITPETLCAGDFDSDGLITVVDAYILYHYFVDTFSQILPAEGLPVVITSEDIEIENDSDEFTITLNLDNQETVSAYQFEIYFNDLTVTEQEIIDIDFEGQIFEIEDGYKILLDNGINDPGYSPGALPTIGITFNIITAFGPTDMCFRNGAAYSPDYLMLDMFGECSHISFAFNPDYSGPVWNVTPEGSDTPDGTIYYPFSSIQAAIDQSVDGDTILVHPGTYIENINYNGHNIMVGSMFIMTDDTSYISQTLIDGNQNDSVVIFESGEDSTAVLSGFTLTNGAGHWIDGWCGGGIFIEDSNPTLEYLQIMGNSVTMAGFTWPIGGGICLWVDANPRISNVTISNNYAYEGAGLFILGGNSLDFTSKFNNLTLVNNYAEWYGGCISIVGTNPEFRLKNSICWNNLAGISDNEIRGEVLVEYSDIKFGYDGIGNIDADPLFVDPENNDYHLQSESPCINSGDPDTDGDGFTWEDDPDDQDPDRTRLDMGAFYYPLNLDPYDGPTFYVAVDGNDINNGALEFPFASIQFAIDRSVEGDTILVAPGTYYENLNYDQKNLIVSSYQILNGNDTFISLTTIDGGNTNPVVHFTNFEYSESVLNGFTITHGVSGDYGYSGGINCTYDANPTLSNLIITENENGGMEFRSSSPHVMHSDIISNTATNGGGINIRIDSRPHIEYVLIADNSASGQGGGLRINNNSHPVLDHVTVANNLSSASGGDGIDIRNASLTMTNSIIWLNSDNYTSGVDTLSINWSDIQFEVEGDGNLQVDPQFIDPDGGDYSLMSISPCIDAGDPDSPLDPDSTVADMGAYYFEQYDCGSYEFMCGDVNGDGIPDILDIVLAVSIIMEVIEPTPLQLCTFDFNGDGVNDILDIVMGINGGCWWPGE